MRQFAWLIALLAGIAACAPESDPADTGDSTAMNPPGEPTASQSALIDREWILASIGDLSEPRGAQDRPVTLRFDSAEARAGGFAGCNRYSAAYRTSGDSVSFEAPIATKMFCEGSMDVETALLGALERVRRFEVTDSTLTLYSEDGPVAQFRAAAPA